MALITVFTPTYNRADLLAKGYEALKAQTCKDFIWLIVDDGSSDDTSKTVRKWMAEDNGFEIRYVYKENGGLHTGYNKAIELMDTELAVCIDSDDYMVSDGIERIKKFWSAAEKDKYAGIIALNITEDGQIFGDKLPDIKSMNLITLQLGKYNIKNADRKLVVRADLYKSVAPQKTFGNEKNFNPHYMHLQISENFDFLVMNEPLCVVEYQVGGMTKSIFKQYKNSPRSFAELRLLHLSFKDAPFKFKIKQYVHLASSCILAKDFSCVKKVPSVPAFILCLPLGALLSVYISFKSK